MSWSPRALQPDVAAPPLLTRHLTMASLTSAPLGLTCPLTQPSAGWSCSSPGLLPSEPQSHTPAPPQGSPQGQPRPRTERGPTEGWMRPTGPAQGLEQTAPAGEGRAAEVGRKARTARKS